MGIRENKEGTQMKMGILFIRIKYKQEILEDEYGDTKEMIYLQKTQSQHQGMG